MTELDASRSAGPIVVLAAIAFTVGIAFSGCALTPPRAAHGIPSYTIHEFLGTTTYRGASFSPDGTRLLVSSDQTGVFNAYSVSIDGTTIEPLTESKSDAVRAAHYFPRDERILFLQDQGGNELDHLFVRERDGKVVDLTPGERLKARFVGWSADHESFYVETNERDPRFFDLYEVATSDYARSLIFKNEDGYSLGAVSPDGQLVALNKSNTRADGDIYLFDRNTQEMRHMSPHTGNINHRAQAFSRDSKELYYLTDADSEFTYLMRANLESGEKSIVVQADWDVTRAGFSRGRKYLVVSVNNDARTELRLLDATTMKPVALPKAGGGQSIVTITFSTDDSSAAYYVTGGRTPRDLFYCAALDANPHRLTRSLNPGIRDADLVEGEVVRFQSFDGTEIPGILYTPHQASPSNRVPALVWVHGGPGGQSRIGYSALIQYLVNHGYAIYAINNRGSSGYGKTFFALDDRNHGKDDLGDCVAAKAMLVKTGYVDAEKIGIIGGSYGGFMVLAALAFRPDAFEVGVDIFGVANWLRTLQSIPAWWESARKSLEREMGAFDDTEYLMSISPLFHAEKIEKPLMVLQGANDPRVLKRESDDIVAAVRKNGVPVDYVVFEDEGHGFRKKANQAKAYEAILAFLDRHLRGEVPPPAPAADDGASASDSKKGASKEKKAPALPPKP